MNDTFQGVRAWDEGAGAVRSLIERPTRHVCDVCGCSFETSRRHGGDMSPRDQMGRDNDWIAAAAEVLADASNDGVMPAVADLLGRFCLPQVLEALRDAADAASDHVGLDGAEDSLDVIATIDTIRNHLHAAREVL